jgi:hypothetical protein
MTAPGQQRHRTAAISDFAVWPVLARPAIRVEWDTMTFGQSGVSGLNDVA